MTLLLLLYETGARVQELIDLASSGIRLDKPTIIRLCRKGNKSRIFLLREQMAEILALYMKK